jgi:uncharacterized membrane protein
VSLRVALTGPAVVGAGIAAYLVCVHYAEVAPVCTTGGCEKGQGSKYAELGGVPVALLGLLAYVALLGLAWVRGDVAAFAGVLVSVVGVAFSGYLLWAQLVPIGAVCQWCVANDVTIAVLAASWIARLFASGSGSRARLKRALPG